MEMPVTRSNKGQNEDGVPSTPTSTPKGSTSDTSKGNDKSALTAPTPIPLIEDDIQAQDNTTGPENKISQSRLDKVLINQMNLLTSTINTMSLQFHAVKQEITLMNDTLSEIKQQQFQLQIQENRESISHIEDRVTEVEASITFNDNERAAMKDQIRIIEQGQKDTTRKLNQLASEQPSVTSTCDCSSRLDQIEAENRKKNIIIAGVIEHRNERPKYLALEILSNTDLHINYNDIEQVVRVGPYRATGPPRPMLVKFREVDLRDQVLVRRHLIKNNPNCSKIWINEDLSEKSKKIRYEMKILGDLAVSLGHHVMLKGSNIIIDDISYSERTLNQLPPHLSLKRAFTRDTPNGIAFHSEHSFLSSFFPVDIEYNRSKYTSAEQGIQHIKAKTHRQEGLAHEIMQTSNPIKIKRIGDRIKPSEEWKKCQDKWAETITFAKYDQNPHLAVELANTKQAPLLECTQSSHWGIGMPISHPDLYKKTFKPKGRNVLGKILEKKREDIQRSIAVPQLLNKTGSVTTTGGAVNPPPTTTTGTTTTPVPTTTTTIPILHSDTQLAVTENKPPPIPPRTTPPPAHGPKRDSKPDSVQPIQPLDFSITINATVAKDK